MDEKKTYSIVGKVEIGTDEYRDLIEGMREAELNAERYRSDYWKAQGEVAELKKQVDTLKEELTKYKEFVKKNATVITEDNITLFAQLLGE